METGLNNSTLTAMLIDCAKLASDITLIESGVLKPFLTKQQAYSMYGRSTVERWLKEGLITPRKDGGHSAKYRIDRVEIKSVAMASNRPSYLSVKERR